LVNPFFRPLEDLIKVVQMSLSIDTFCGCNLL
jgi:hypothetical protein